MPTSALGARPSADAPPPVAGGPPPVDGIAVLLAKQDQIDDLTATVETQQRTLDEHFRRQYGDRPSDRHTSSTGRRNGQR